MSLIRKNLADLTAAVGIENLIHLPDTESIDVAPQSEDEDAFGYKLYYGIGQVTSTKQGMSKIWIYLITHATHPHLLRFVVYEDNDERSVPVVLDGQYIGRIVEEQAGTAAAFGTITKNRKIQSLAKYYFLSFMHELGCKDEELKAPFNITKTWVEELKAVCYEFASETTARKNHRKTTTAPVGNLSARSSEGTLRLESRRVSGRIINHTQEENNMDPLSTPSDPPAGLLDSAGEGQTNIADTVEPQAIDYTENGDLHQSAIEARYVLRSARGVSAAPSQISVSASSVTISATPEAPHSREHDLATFNSIQIREENLSQTQRTVREEKHQRVKQMKNLQDEIDALDKKEVDLCHDQEVIDKKKRDLLDTMSHAEQLKFVYDAGRTAAKKRTN